MPRKSVRKNRRKTMRKKGGAQLTAQQVSALSTISHDDAVAWVSAMKANPSQVVEIKKIRHLAEVDAARAAMTPEERAKMDDRTAARGRRGERSRVPKKDRPAYDACRGI